MKQGMYLRRRPAFAGVLLKAGFLLGAALLCGQNLKACGPFFPDTILDADTPSVLAAPSVAFSSELALLAAGREPSILRSVSQGVSGTLPSEQQELRGFLLAKGVEAGLCVKLVAAYTELRSRDGLRFGSPEQEPSQSTEASAESGLESREVPPSSKPVVSTSGLADLEKAIEGLPAEIPPEFGQYLRGALAWKAGDVEQATQDWLKLLSYPEGERRHRSVWAAYMLGRCAQAKMRLLKGVDAEAPAQEATRWFTQARALAAQGLPDVAGLAAESLGWEGQLALSRGDFARALDLYFQQYLAHDETAFQSLRMTAARALKAKPEQLERLASDPLCRRLMSAFVLSRARESTYDDFPPEGEWAAQSKAWCLALGKLPVGPLPEADHLAWIAYEAGDGVCARNWLVHATSSSPVTWWLHAKIELRETGNRRAAETFYREALARPGLDETQLRRLQAELGRLCLANDEFEAALEAWLAAGDWEAAAYVAESVMSTKALQTFVDARTAESKPGQELLGSLRYLLARRLGRETSAEALRYFVPEQADFYRVYLAHLRQAHDVKQAALARGRAFMAAARIARHQGMELFGTELAPDAFIHGGSYDISPRRREYGYNSKDPLGPSQLEQELVEKHPLPQQGRRYHYRYRAADLAWLGASLLPNDSEETAGMLCEAGSWLKNRDPAAADLFYKALVVRCPSTRLGAEAEALHWFPALPEEKGFDSQDTVPDWGVRPGWLLLCWGFAIAVPLGMALAASRFRRRA